MLIEKFGNNLKFLKSSYNTSSDELIADCINAAGKGMQSSVALRNIARSSSLDTEEEVKNTEKFDLQYLRIL